MVGRVTILDAAREGMNPDIRPQDDLFGHVNGRWLDDTEIPQDKSSWGAFIALADAAEQQVRDIITDLAAAVTGGIGLAASGNINMDHTAPSMFEPVHGSAPDIAGQQKADPTAAILSAALLLQHLGLAGQAARIEQAVEHDVATRAGATRTTAEIGDAIAAAIS